MTAFLERLIDFGKNSGAELENGEMAEAASNRSLARRIGDGDRSAEDDLVERFQRRLLLMSVARTRDGEAARDLTQEILLSVLQALREGKLRQEDRLSGFVHGTARNQINSYLQSLRQRQEQPDLPERPPVESPEERFEQAERAALIRQALGRLRPQDRKILLLILVDGLKPGEIAGRLGLGPEAVRKRKSRALQRIRRAVREVSRK